jgi:hypothetical protein
MQYQAAVMNTFEPMSNTIGVRYGEKNGMGFLWQTESGGAFSYNRPKSTEVLQCHRTVIALR